jgi:hypothetical protein
MANKRTLPFEPSEHTLSLIARADRIQSAVNELWDASKKVPHKFLDVFIGESLEQAAEHVEGGLDDLWDAIGHGLRSDHVASLGGDKGATNG